MVPVLSIADCIASPKSVLMERATRPTGWPEFQCGVIFTENVRHGCGLFAALGHVPFIKGWALMSLYNSIMRRIDPYRLVFNYISSHKSQ